MVSIVYRRKQFKLRGPKKRQEFRRRLALKFLAEDPGTGTGSNATGYCYYVERLSEGHWVTVAPKDRERH